MEGTRARYGTLGQGTSERYGVVHTSPQLPRTMVRFATTHTVLLPTFTIKEHFIPLAKPFIEPQR